MLKNQRNSIGSLRAVLMGAAATAVLALPAFGQAGIETVTVTGTLIQGNTNLVSPVTVIDTSNLDKSGISSIEGALQQTLANNGPSINNSWTANGNFAQGASAVSLRGLTTNSTLVMFDGMRAAYYPLADDGIRNFVDLNTIPDDIVENIEILRDGASSAYGADAIAGVINIKTKREFQGFSARAEAGIADRGDAPSWKVSMTAGVGDLSKDRVNFYLTASYYHSDILYAKSRPYPFNTYDWRNVCADTQQFGHACGNSLQIWGSEDNTNSDGTYAIDARGEFLIRPGHANADGSFTPLTGSRYQNINSDCGIGGNKYTLSAFDKTGKGAANPDWVCQYDIQKTGGVIDPMVTRFGISGHSAFALPQGIEGYVEANFMQDTVGYPVNTAPRFVSTIGQPGIYYPPFRTSGQGGTYNPNYAPGSFIMYLPNWVCPERKDCATQTDRRLNPNNPFADANNPVDARIIGYNHYIQPYEETRDRTYRVAGELNGSLFSDWKWNVGFTASHVDLRREDRGYGYVQHEMDLVADGNFNFLDPSKNNTPLTALNGQTANQYLYPTNITPASSDLAQAKVSITAPLYKLPGGDLTLVGGATIYYEAVDGPSANSDINGPTMRYFSLNAFGTKGGRDVYAGFFEINAPILEELVLNASGRYDSYSSGQSNFSPKIGFWSRPLDWLTFKGTYSEGFRAPSFAEANALPTTGYVAYTSGIFTDAYLQQWGSNCTVINYSKCPSYVSSASYGLTTVANPNLDPEHSRSWVFDLTLNPTDELTLQVTYYNIKKTGAIANLDCKNAIKTYFGASGLAFDPRCVVHPDTADVNNPTAKPRIAYVDAPLVNQNAIRTAGFDFDVIYNTDLDGVERLLGVEDLLGTVNLYSDLQATFIQNLDTKLQSGAIQRYDGTLGNNSLTAGTGTPKWRGRWQTTLTGGAIEFTSTLNWNSGYNVSAMDVGGEYRDCSMNDGSVPCRISDYFTWDANTQYKLNENMKLYFTVNNVLDAMPPVDTIGTYGLTGYNVVVGGDGILGRYMKLGIKIDY